MATGWDPPSESDDSAGAADTSEQPGPPDPTHAGYSGAGGALPPPNYPWGTSPYGASPPGQPGLPSGQTVRRRRRFAVVIALVVADVLVVGGAGLAVGLSINHSSSSSPTTSVPGLTGSAPTPAIDVASIAARVDPAVVDVTSTVAGGGHDAGTGMIISADGLVLTNNHVVYDSIGVTAQIDGTGTTYKVRVLGVDPTKDVALLQMVGVSGLHTVQLGDSSNLSIGEPVVAIGNALALKGSPTVTTGIVSALGRSITAGDAGSQLSENLHGLIQIDAPINPGNSGGPLVDSAGQVIGMNTATATGSAAQPATDIGFSIPINTAVSIAQQIEHGDASSTIEIGEQGFIGVEVDSLSVAESSSGLSGPFGNYQAPVDAGAVVVEVVAGTPAASAGLAVGDVITSFAGHTIATPADLHDAVKNLRPNVSTQLGWVSTNGTHHTATISLAVKPVE